MPSSPFFLIPSNGAVFSEHSACAITKRTLRVSKKERFPRSRTGGIFAVLPSSHRVKVGDILQARHYCFELVALCLAFFCGTLTCMVAWREGVWRAAFRWRRTNNVIVACCTVLAYGAVCCGSGDIGRAYGRSWHSLVMANSGGGA